MDVSKNKTIQPEHFIIFALTALMVAIPCMHYYCALHYKPASYIANAIYICTFICCISIIFSVRQLKNIKPGFTDIVIAVTAVLLVLCTVNSPFPSVSLFGASGRKEGLLMLFSYFIFFISVRFITTDKSRNILVNAFLVITGLHALYGMCQFYDIGSWVLDSYHYAISGVTGNPNFMGALMVLSLGICAGMFLYAGKWHQKAVYLSGIILFTATLVFTRTTSAYIAAAAMTLICAIMIICQIKKYKGNNVAVVAAITMVFLSAAVYIVADHLLYGLLSKELVTTFSQLKNYITTGYADEYFMSGRLVIWKNVSELIPENLMWGVGIECLEPAYYNKAGLYAGRYVDKAHNELMNILVTMGLPVFLCYISLYTSVFISGIKKLAGKEKSPVYYAAIIAFCGYFVQGMFNISVIDVAPYFWIICGLMAPALNKT